MDMKLAAYEGEPESAGTIKTWRIPSGMGLNQSSGDAEPSGRKSKKKSLGG